MTRNIPQFVISADLDAITVHVMCAEHETRIVEKDWGL